MGAVSPAMRRDGAYSHARASLLSSCRHASILDHEWFRETVGDDEDTWSRGVSESACVYDGRLSCFPRDTRHSVKSDGKVRQCLCLEVKGGLTGGYSTNPHLISLFH